MKFPAGGSAAAIGGSQIALTGSENGTGGSEINAGGMKFCAALSGKNEPPAGLNQRAVDDYIPTSLERGLCQITETKPAFRIAAAMPGTRRHG